MVTLATRMALQSRRRAELDALRLRRPLTAEERAEADNLADRLYMRVWRAQQREREAAMQRQLYGRIESRAS